ncbi:MAG TPA: ATP-binding protein [Gammaproteobacteria bacterium]|nr:ATP-binding protein [Gammaproteobacteria bacterium]
MQLRHKFFLALSLLTTVPLLILLFGVVDRMESEIKARTENLLHATLDKMAGELDVLLNSQKSIAVGLARVPSVRRFASTLGHSDTQTYDARAEELGNFFLNYQHAVSSIQALRFIDLRGKTLVKVKEGKPIEPTVLDAASHRYYVSDQSYKDYFRRALAGQRDVSVSDFELGQVTAGADFCPSMVRYSVLIKDELDTLEGLLVVNMWGKRLDATVEASLGGYPGRVYIVELNDGSPRDGIFLYHPDSSKRFANQLGTQDRLSRELTPAEWQHIKDTPVFGSLYRDDGRMLFYRKFSPYQDRATQWLLVIETASDTVLAPVMSMRRSIWLLMGILLVLSLLVAVWAAVRMAKPFQKLATTIKRYADGERDLRYTEKRRDEIGAAGHAFNYLAGSLERAREERERAERAARQSERLAAVGQLAAGIGHEINNPLMNIMSLASLIEQSVKDGHDPQIESDLHLLQKEGKRCARIVQGILNFARENQPAYRRLDLSALVDDTVALLGHRFESAGISVDTDLQRPLEITGDPNQLQQVLVNVLLNAAQASPADSTVSIASRREGDESVLTVVDQGEGVAEEDLGAVFDPFFSTKPEGAGTGLGLSVSYGIIKRHGGDIALQNGPHGGAMVTIAIPVAGDEAQQSDESYAMENRYAG